MQDFLRQRGVLGLLALAVLLRILIMPFYFHPDIKTYHFQSSFLKHGVFNIYDYLLERRDELPIKESFVYFPFTYLLLGGYQIATSPLLGEGFEDWLYDASENRFENPQIFRYLFILKFPYLVLDLVIAFLLIGFFKKRENKKRAFLFWLFNPFTISLIYIFSNVDIIPVAISVIAFLYMSGKRLVAASLALGVASAFKPFPLLFLPFLFLVGKNLRQKLLVVAAPVTLLLFVVLPFIGAGFSQSALVSGLTTRIFQAGFSLGFGESMLTTVVLISALFFWAFGKIRQENVMKYYIALFLIIFGFSHFHIQWLLWITPFLLIYIVKRRNLTVLVLTLSLLAFLIPVLYEDKSMTSALLKPFSTLYNFAPIPFSAVQRFYSAYSLQSILHSVFAGGVLIFIWRLLSAERKGT